MYPADGGAGRLKEQIKTGKQNRNDVKKGIFPPGKMSFFKQLPEDSGPARTTGGRLRSRPVTKMQEKCKGAAVEYRVLGEYTEYMAVS